MQRCILQGNRRHTHDIRARGNSHHRRMWRRRMWGRGPTLIAGVLAASLLGPGMMDQSRAAEKPPKESELQSFMALAPFQLTVLSRGRPLGLVSLEIGLDVPDEDLRERVKASLPRLRDHMMRSLNAYGSRNIRFDQPLDMNRIAGRLQTIADAYGGDETITVLLINATMFRR